MRTFLVLFAILASFAASAQSIGINAVPVKSGIEKSNELQTCVR